MLRWADEPVSALSSKHSSAVQKQALFGLLFFCMGVSEASLLPLCSGSHFAFMATLFVPHITDKTHLDAEGHRGVDNSSL